MATESSRKSLVNQAAVQALHVVRTSRGRPRRVLLWAMAGFSALQVALAWLCLPFFLAGRPFRRGRGGKKQILIISMGGIGDNVLAIPLTKAIRRKYPNHAITLVVRPQVAGFAGLLPGDVDRELVFRSGTTATSHLLDPIRALRFVARNRLDRGAEMAIVPLWSTDVSGAGFIAFFSRASKRVGFRASVEQERQYRNWLYDTFYTHLSRTRPDAHEGDKLATLLLESEGVDAPRLPGLLSGGLWSPSGRPMVVLAPFAGRSRRNWPLGSWIELTQEIRRTHQDAEFLIVGGSSDRPQAATIAAGGGHASNHCGVLSFTELLGLLLTADACVGGDTGVTHLAAAAGVPVIALSCHPLGASPSHYNSPVRFAPVADRLTLIQPRPNSGCEAACEASEPCCIRNIDSGEVAEALRVLLRELGGESGATGNGARV